MLCALPLVVPWNMIPMLWLGMIDPRSGLIGPALAAVGFDHKFTALHTWALILVMDTWHWLGLVVVLAYAALSAIPPAWRQAAAIDGASRWAVFSPYRAAAPGRRAGHRAAAAVRRQFHDLYRGLRDQRRRPGDATRFLTLELGEEIKGFSYGQAAARAVLYFLFVLAAVWAFVVATRRREGAE